MTKTPLPKMLIEMYESGSSLPDICKSDHGKGWSISTIRSRLMEIGALRSRPDSVLLASRQGKLKGNGRKNGFVVSESGRKNISEARKKWSDSHASGVTLKRTGYLERTRGDQAGKREHVAIMEELIGRKLTDDECVHHINEDKTDNSPENLKLMTKSEHSSHHAIKRLPRMKRKENGQFA